MSVKYPPVSPFNKHIWHYDKADSNAIRYSIQKFPWERHLAGLSPDEQAGLFTEPLLNIFTNFIPNKNINVESNDPPCINCLKNLFRHSKRASKTVYL